MFVYAKISQEKYHLQPFCCVFGDIHGSISTDRIKTALITPGEEGPNNGWFPGLPWVPATGFCLPGMREEEDFKQEIVCFLVEIKQLLCPPIIPDSEISRFNRVDSLRI